MFAGYRPVYALNRGGQPESVHFGAIAVVNANGELVASYGEVQLAVFLRSAAKPFQALPFVLAGGMEHYRLSSAELALICASHSGTDEHVQLLTQLMAKCSVTEEQLLCGAHPPYHAATAERLRRAGIAPTPARQNCSGKHAGMLAYAAMRGWDLASYIDPTHPLQQEILAIFGELAGMAPDALAVGIDGCSAPNWAAPLYNTAQAYARLMDPSELPAAQAAACEKIAAAMRANPGVVAGPQRFDTDLMTTASGRLLAKGGAEGFQAIGLPPGALGAGSPGIGIALKIADGDGRAWAGHAVTLEVLRQLGALSAAELGTLASYGPVRPVRNWRGLDVGHAEPVFSLENE